MTQEQPVRRAKHLMDPDAPRRAPDPGAAARVQWVQTWVMSVLVVTTIGHLAAGLAIFAQYVDEDARSAGIGLSVLAGAFGVIGVAAGLAIHRKSLVSPWLLLGVLPGVISAYLVLR
ncbi:hypothetical protein NPS01_19470 [Nocardioides psychrotolerans]|uniref:Major facilitator superfamily (MFS) profile domain-containing protein n=1 Tax=Nocardioides psychrotolerans TaxID=1005945 RepID=A0A1I3J471_9ACTN|nr:hypothetical protein [Nocardioides psychrotolerans]GEP38284.1 hypothetical protein NPS01_19470 [Nocardioides psychrotolerans]SFI54896.1 hypothetical protein SAMN05216561_1102 [Nocardioides psychrotolerans]